METCVSITVRIEKSTGTVRCGSDCSMENIIYKQCSVNRVWLYTDNPEDSKGAVMMVPNRCVEAILGRK